MKAKTTLDIVWSLYPSVEDMATDLKESPRVIREAMETGTALDARHDHALVVRARFLGKRLTMEDLMEARKRSPHHEREKDERRDAIQAFYDACGGVPVLHKKLGVRPNYLYVCKTRGSLPRAMKYEMMLEAERNGYELAPDLFVVPD